MSLATVHSRALRGLSAPAVRVEAHLANGLPLFTIVGLPEASVRESRERVRAAILNSGLEFPNRRITVNLAPADLPKESGRFDLPIALGVLAASGQIPQQGLEHFEFAGELSLTGGLQPVRAALALACGAAGAASGCADPAVGIAPAGTAPGCTPQRQRCLVLPLSNLAEAAHAGHPALLGAATLQQVVRHLRQPAQVPLHLQAPATDADATPPHDDEALEDLSDVLGQLAARRALEIAAAGHHALLLHGPPGTGKSMLARRLVGILPPWSRQAALQSASIASLSGRFDAGRLRRPPFRHPHHSVSTIGLVGGGCPPRPGEISQAHHGVLFLDELPEFRRSALEALREPLETGEVLISRGARSETFPAAFRLVAAMNPCPCGYAGDGSGRCHCSPEEIRRYRGRLSGPLLDRFDLCVEVAREAIGASTVPHPGSAGESSATVAARVAAAAQQALQRQGVPNGRLPSGGLEEAVSASAAAIDWARRAASRMGWSMRGYHRSLKVARTLADLDGRAHVDVADVTEAVAYRHPFD